jgi:hypothetical protein
MRYYLDTEFNGFGGELMSLALVPEDRAQPSFYVVLEMPGRVDPWVQKHVVPYLMAQPEQRSMAATRLCNYLNGAKERPVIVADWPTDFEHLLELLIVGPGMMLRAPDFDMEFRRLTGFNTATASRIPHNALADAEALRDYCEGLRA